MYLIFAQFHKTTNFHSGTIFCIIISYCINQLEIIYPDLRINLHFFYRSRLCLRKIGLCDNKYPLDGSDFLVPYMSSDRVPIAVSKTTYYEYSSDADGGNLWHRRFGKSELHNKEGKPDFGAAGDVIGCGVNLASCQLIFTKNGHRLGLSAYLFRCCIKYT